MILNIPINRISTLKDLSSVVHFLLALAILPLVVPTSVQNYQPGR